MLFENEIKLSRTREVRRCCVFKLPFGEELTAGTGGRTTAQGYTASDNVRQQFTSKERDNETGLDYSTYRYYSSSQGRFTSPDPLLASAKFSDPQSWNRYTYCRNNPLLYVDPLGLLWYHNSGTNELRWFDDVPTEDGWKQWNQYAYYAGEEYGWVALDPRSRAYQTGFETQEDAAGFSADLEYATAMAQDPPSSTSQFEYFMEMQMFTGVGGIARAGIRGGAMLLTEEGAEAAIRAGAGAATRTAQVLINRAVAKEAEAIVAKQLEQEGFRIVGSQVGVRTSLGLRFIDHLVQDPAKNLIAIEVKSGGGVRNAMQIAKDAEMATQGATIVGKNAPEALRGRTIVIPTVVRTVPR